MFDGGIVGKEACRHGPVNFLILASMHGLWGLAGEV